MSTRTFIQPSAEKLKGHHSYYVPKPLTESQMRRLSEESMWNIVLRHRLLKKEEEKSLISAVQAGAYAAEKYRELVEPKSGKKRINPAIERNVPKVVKRWEQERFERAQADMLIAQEKMTVLNMRLAFRVASLFRVGVKDLAISVDDLTMIAAAAIPKLIANFDYRKAGKFSTYATKSMFYLCLREVDKARIDNKLGINSYYKLKKKVEPAIDELKTRLGRYPSIREIAEEAGIKNVPMLVAYMDVTRPRKSLGAEVSQDNDTTLGEILTVDASLRASEDASLENVYKESLGNVFQYIRKLGVELHGEAFNKWYDALLLYWGVYPEGNKIIMKEIDKLLLERYKVDQRANNGKKEGLMYDEIAKLFSIFTGKKQVTTEAIRQRVEKGLDVAKKLVASLEPEERAQLAEIILQN